VPDLSIKIDTRRVDELLRTLPDTLARKALVRALNKAAENVRVAASKAIREKRSLSAKTVRDAFSLVRANPSKLVATIKVTGNPVPLTEYKARHARRLGVSVMVTPGQRKRVRHAGNKAFISAKLGGHVFAREGTERLPIKKLFGPSLPSTMLNAEVRQAWEATAQEAIVKRAAEEVNNELRKMAERAAR
jgi:hypothetical protein